MAVPSAPRHDLIMGALSCGLGHVLLGRIKLHISCSGGRGGGDAREGTIRGLRVCLSRLPIFVLVCSPPNRT